MTNNTNPSELVERLRNDTAMTPWHNRRKLALEAADLIERLSRPTDTQGAVELSLDELVAPYQHHDGEPPEYDSPLRCVYESGVQYAVDLLAKTLEVKEFDYCDGTEEFDGDLAGTMFNIVLAAMPTDASGDPIHPSELRAALSSIPNAVEAEGVLICDHVNCRGNSNGRCNYAAEPNAVGGEVVQADYDRLNYIATCIDVHADKFPAPSHMREHAKFLRERRLAHTPGEREQIVALREALRVIIEQAEVTGMMAIAHTARTALTTDAGEPK